jgi:folate-binding protein YgfZ
LTPEERLRVRPGDPPDALGAARSRVAAGVPGDRSLRVVGADRISFLHRLLSCDVAGTPVGGAIPGLLLTAKGRVTADFVLAVLPDRVELIVPAEGIAALRDGLAKFVIADDVALGSPSEEDRVLSVLGPSTDATLARLLEAPPPAAAAFEAEARGTPVLFVRRRRAGLPAVDVLARPPGAEGVRERILDGVREEGGVPLLAGGFEALRVENGVPRLGAEFGEETLPQEAGLEPWISFTKGCFLGQEPVARLRTQGHTNRGLAGLLPESLPARGDAVLLGGKEVGAVTSALVSPTLGRPVALALLRHGAAAPGTAVTIRAAAGPVGASVARLPFVE